MLGVACGPATRFDVEVRTADGAGLEGVTVHVVVGRSVDRKETTDGHGRVQFNVPTEVSINDLWIQFTRLGYKTFATMQWVDDRLKCRVTLVPATSPLQSTGLCEGRGIR